MIAIGIQYNLVKMTRKITVKRRADIKADLLAARTTTNRRHWNHLVVVLWFVSPCVRAAIPHTYAIAKAAAQACHTNRAILKTLAVQSALDWWVHFTDEIANPDSQWHGGSITPIKHREVNICMGDAGSEWGMGGLDRNHYFYAKWPDHEWQAVQRRKSSSSLHMEALQVLVAARALGATRANTAVTMRLDCLALVHTLRKGYHQHNVVNTIMQALSDLQIKHSFALRPMWVR